MVLAWENFRRFLWCWSSFCCCCCCCCFSFIFICRRFSFCWCCIFNRFPVYFAMSPALHLGFSDPWRFPPTLSSTLTTFDWLFIFIYRECYGFELAFFTLHSSLTFCHNLLLSRFHREPAVTFLKVAGLHTDLRNTDLTDLFVWFTVNHNLLYILNLYLCMSIAIAKVLLVVKTLIKKYKSAAMKI